MPDEFELAAQRAREQVDGWLRQSQEQAEKAQRVSREVEAIRETETASDRTVTVAVDAVRRRVFDVEPGRDKTAVKNVGEKLERNGGNTKSVNSVTSDMSATMILPRNPEKRRTRFCVMPSGKWNRQASVCGNWIC